MDREWTYRPPVLVGERVVWLGGASELGAGESSSRYHPYHGTVSWIGHVPEMGNDWTVGVEFDLDMADGCDGTWKGRRLFSCTKMRGLFLPVASLIREREFYDSNGSTSPSDFSSKTSTSIDLSCAPDPPPPKNKTSSHASSFSHIRDARKTEDGGAKTSHHPTHKNMGASSAFSPITGTDVVITSQCPSTDISTHTSKKELLAGRHINTGSQDTSQDSSFSQEEILCTTSGSVTETGAASKLENEGDHNENLTIESMYFGETMVRKSTLTTKDVFSDYSERVRITHQSSISTPSSPSLSEYQRHYGKKLSCSSTSTTASDLSKCMSTPGRYSASQSPYFERKERSGFFNIFRWFRNRDKKKQSASVDGMSNTSSGSISSLSSSFNSSAYSPIIRSKSADIKNRVNAINQSQFGITRRYKLFSKNSLGRTNSSSNSEESGRRLSVISACSETSSRPGSRGATLTRKKRPAPQPPGSPKLSDTESLKSQKSSASLPARELRPIKTAEPSSPTSPDEASKVRLHKSKSEGVIYTRVKRRAPLPPVQTNTRENIDKEPSKVLPTKGHCKPQAPAIPCKSTARPISSVSNVSSLSQSFSSASTTLKSQSSSITSSGPSSSQYSTESMVLESGSLRQNIAKSSSSPAIADTGKVTLSPRPWYKRKNKHKESSKSVAENEKNETVYDSWMPEIQFARRKLNLGSSLKKGKTHDISLSSKEDKKEKRKSQVSLLANISELDRAASEQMQREQEHKQVQKQNYDSKFYRTNEPHFLTQTDFLPQAKGKHVEEASDMGTLSSTGTTTLKSSTSVKTDMGEEIVNNESGVYDNLSLSGQDFTLPQSYSKQATLRMEEKEKLQHSTTGQVHANYDMNYSVEVSSSLEISSLTTSNNRSTPEASKFQSIPSALEPPTHVTRDSPLHRATIDAELFYQLAKDTQGPIESKVRSSPVLSGIRESKKLISGQGNGGETEDENIHISDSPSSPRRPNKNFGFRMNNFFSPDVSTIIEASESMTSSATTPADDLYDDFPVSLVNGKGRRESIQDEMNSEVNHEFQLNSSDAREIMKELADVRQEIDKINEEEKKESQERELSKAEKIREEVLHLREANNFEAWHNAVEQKGGKNAAEITSPSLINLNEGVYRKLKWVCEVCTLNNLPWRLQCEACMARRPVNPRRVDDDGKSLASDFVSPQASVSNESPITVIFEDGNGNRECPREVLEGTGAIASNEETPENVQSCPTDQKKKDINWEIELQKYFRTFDEHVKGNNFENSGEKDPRIKSSRTDASANKETYGKTSQKSAKETGATAHSPLECDNESRGAKPKINFFGTASGPPSTFIPGPEASHQIKESNRQKDSSFITEELYTNENSKNLPDVETIRKARLAKFQGHMKSENYRVMGEHIVSDEEKKTKIENNRGYKNCISESQEFNKAVPEINESFTQRKDTRGFSNPEYKIQEKSSGKPHHKPQVIKPSGAVRTVVSIFNQFEQLKKANQEKPPVRRKTSSGNLIERTQAFEQVLPELTSPEFQGARRKDRGHEEMKAPCQRDKEVFSAIAKFDEMAAMAEVESINKFRHKSRVTRRPKVLKTSTEPTFQASDTSMISVNMASRSSKTMRHAASLQSSSNHDNSDLHGNASLDCKSILHSEGVIKDGVLYTEQRKRSSSISSGTFELIHAKDFVNIEAQHSESSSYSKERGIDDATSPTPSGETRPIPHFMVEQVNGDGCPVDLSDDPPLVALETGAEPDGRQQLECKDVERLSRQLTEAEGIATFKANLRVEEPALGQTNTLNINKLLKRLEGAIARGNHAEAAKLAHELADFRVSCSVTRNNKNTCNTVSSTDQGGSTSRSQEDRQLAPVLSDTESPRMQVPSSNTSECYYDAPEILEDAELSISDHDHLLNMVCTSSLEKLVENKKITGPQTPPVISSTNSTVTSTNSSVLPQSKQISITDSSHEIFNGTEPQQENKKCEASSNQEPPKFNHSFSAMRRDIRVDPARREVKSDTINKLPDGLHIYMKEDKQSNQPFNVKMYVEDKNSHQGPLSFTVTSTMTVGQLREKVRQDFGFPPEVQRWILGKRLADDDSLTLEHHKVTSEGCPIFLYLVAPEPEPHTNTSSKGNIQERGCYGENYRDSDLQAPGIRASGMPRCLEVYDEEGNVEYRYYNPESRRYEVSEDLDDSDLNEEEEDEGEDEEEEDEDEDDTLEEDELEEIIINENMYQNVNKNSEEKLRHTNTELTMHTSGKSSMQNSGTQRNDSLDTKYLLPPPITAHQKINNKNELLNQSNIINGYSSPTCHGEEVALKSSEQPEDSLTRLHVEEMVPTDSESKIETALKLPSQRLGSNNPSDIEAPGGHQMKQEQELQNKQQTQHPSQFHQPSQPLIMKEYSHVHSAMQFDSPLNNDQNESQLEKASQEDVYNRLQNQKNQQKMQISFKEKVCHSQSSNIGLNLDVNSQRQQKSQHQEIHSLSGPAKQQFSESNKQKQQAEHQASNKILLMSQPDRSTEEIPFPSRVHEWVCPMCTLVNKWSRPGCEACATERPGTSHQQVVGAMGKGSGLGAVVSVLDRQGCVPNPDPFECRVCFLDVDSGQGVVLRDCLHTFCRDCLSNAIKYSETADVKCPYKDSQYSCDSSLQDREIKALVTEKEYEQHLNKSVKQAEGAMQNVFHCKTPDCPGFCQYEDNVNEFHCDVCEKVNCLTCQAQHGGITCKEYQDDLANKVDEAAMKTKKFFDDMIRRGDGLPCPKCSVMLVRKWGCDWMRCPMCRTEICWVTRGPRWGPGGPGDVSGGCKCGIRGQKCHPKCTYCH